MGYKVMVVGGGGREHALAWKIAQSPLCDKLYLAPGNPLSEKLGERIDIAATDIRALRIFAEQEEIDLTVIGPEAPLVAGIVDDFQRAGLRVFGPSLAASQLEGSKIFSKNLMKKYLIPTARFQIARSKDEALETLAHMPAPVVIKADGLAEGKGAFVCKTEEDAKEAIRIIFSEKRFGEAGLACIFEEFMHGQEASLFVLTDGKTVMPLMVAQDHKAAFDGDEGPNTGGMGSYAPASVLSGKIMDRALADVVIPTIHAMGAENCHYKGLLYVGLMVRGSEARVVEYNCRFGDPEVQPLMLMLKSDILPILYSIAEGKLGDETQALEWHDGAAMGVVMASGGYPDAYEKGKAITGLEDVAEDVIVFGAGVGGKSSAPVTSGGRVLCVTARGDSLAQAKEKVYAGIKKIHFEGAHYRTDIGHRALKTK